jgi:hypothetical protein
MRKEKRGGRNRKDLKKVCDKIEIKKDKLYVRYRECHIQRTHILTNTLTHEQSKVRERS